MTGQGRVADSGLQSERTALAWFRTALAFAAIGGLLLHVSHALTSPVPGVLGAVALAAGGAGVLSAGPRYRSTDLAVRAGRPAAPPEALVAGTAALAVMLPLVLLAALLAGAL